MFSIEELGYIAEQEGDFRLTHRGKIQYIKKQLRKYPNLANDEDFQEEIFMEANLDFDSLSATEVKELESCLIKD